MKRDSVLRPYRPHRRRAAAPACTYARACKMQNTRVRVRATLPSRDLLCDHRAFFPSQRAFFFPFRLPFLRDCEPSAPGHPSWILMDGDSRTRGRIPADADPQEERMRAEKIAAWGGINFRLAFLPALLPPLHVLSCGFFRNAPLGVNVDVVVSQKRLFNIERFFNKSTEEDFWIAPPECWRYH